jgi:hypothetical protein
MFKLPQALAGAAMLAVAALAVCLIVPSGAAGTAIAPGDDPASNPMALFRQGPARPTEAPSPAAPARVGEASAEVLAEEWVATGGGNGPHGSPKG